MSDHETYHLDIDQLDLLRRIEKGLHGDGSILSPDARRDLANLASLVVRQIEQQPLKD